MARQKDINAINLRLYSIYGPFEEPTRLIPKLIVYGLNGRLPSLVAPDIAHDFVYVEDAVDAMILAASTRSIPRGAIYNVASQIQVTLAEVVRLASCLMRITVEPKWSSLDPRPWDSNVWVGSRVAITRDLGWRPHIDLTSGLQRTVCWFQHNPEWLHLYSSRITGSPHAS